MRGRHPLFFRKMIKKPDRALPAGGAVFVRDREGKPVGTGFYNPRTDLALRMFHRGPVDDVEAHLLAMIDDACDLREKRLKITDQTDGYRLVHAEGDGIPGLLLDRLSTALVAQVFSLGVMKHMEAIGEHLLLRYPKSQMSLTVDSEAAKREGIDKVPPSRGRQVTVTEHGIRYLVSPGTGHKTGFFADQRDTRFRVRQLAKGRRVLDLCCNSGGFAMNAMVGGAKEAIAVDLDEAMIEQTKANAKENDLRLRAEHGDAFDCLREIDDGRYDLIVLDPPKWARGKTEVEAAAEKYLDFNRLAFKKLNKGGILATFSCSGAVTEWHFHKILAEAANHAGKDVRILYSGGAAADHPVALECPETRYLKAVILEIR